MTRGLELRYSRRRDRVLSLLWPPKRRRLAMMQAMYDVDAEEIERHAALASGDMLLYGEAFLFLDSDGDLRRVDPREVKVHRG